MSIIAQATQGGRISDALLFAVILVCSAVAVALAIRLRVFKKESIIGPDRLAPGEPLGGVAIGLFAGLMLWLLIPAFMLAGSLPKLPEGPTTIPAEPATRPTTTSAAPQIPQDKLVVASTVSAAIAFAAMVALATVFRRAGRVGLGLSLRQLPAGIKSGLIGAAVMVPLVFLSAKLTDLLWQAIHYDHEKSHELLKLLGESQRPLMSALLVASAVAVAPLFEETLFRGHLQTLFAYAFRRLGRYRQSPAFDVIPITPPSAAPIFPELIAPPPPAPPDDIYRPGVAARWLAIVITSLLFSAVHPAWTIPPIFVLSCCLGYAYERTANLWTVIVMHACFNLTSTLIFLAVASRTAGAAGW
jgi:membrane protease YdiL (CAAX protease family)